MWGFFGNWLCEFPELKNLAWKTVHCHNYRQLVNVNSLAPGKFEWHFNYLIFQMISVINGWGISCELALRWTSLDPTDDKSTLVQVMACCLTDQAITWANDDPDLHISPYGITRPQWVNAIDLWGIAFCYLIGVSYLIHILPGVQQTRTHRFIQAWMHCDSWNTSFANTFL